MYLLFQVHLFLDFSCRWLFEVVFTQFLRILTLFDIFQYLILSLTIFPVKQLKNLSILIYFKHLRVNHLFNYDEVMSIIKLSFHVINPYLEVPFQLKVFIIQAVIYGLIIYHVLLKVMTIQLSIVIFKFILSLIYDCSFVLLFPPFLS